MTRGFNGVVLKAFGANDYRLVVTSVEDLSDKYRRIGFAAGGLLAHHPVHPTQWIRMWFPDGSGRLQQRGYTLVNPDPAGDRFDVEFALHNGPAAQWAEKAVAGDQIDATVLGSKFAVPEPTPSEFVVFGDTASLPAINSLLDAVGDVPVRVWLEWQYESDRRLPVHAGSAATVTWLPRVNYGQLLREHAESMTCSSDAFAWVACDSATTRFIAKTLKTKHRLPKTAVKAQAYWT
jgi:NADPH-dependent ferric siderophore reductase